MTTPVNITPKQKLADSRRAIVGHMTHHDEAEAASNGTPGQAADGTSTEVRRSVWKTLKRSALMWWRHHPAHMALEVATGVAKPILSKYAEEKPMQLLGTAAVLGAAVVLVRPWRLVSITGLLLATVKSPGLSPALMSLITPEPAFTNPPEDISKTG